MLGSLLKINATSERIPCMFRARNMNFSFRLTSVAIRNFAEHHRHRASSHGAWQSCVSVISFVALRAHVTLHHLRCNCAREQSKITLFWHKIHL